MGEIRTKPTSKAYRENFDKVFGRSSKKKGAEVNLRRIKRILDRNVNVDE